MMEIRYPQGPGSIPQRRPPRPAVRRLVAAAVGLLGWEGVIRGPIAFGGVGPTFAVVDQNRPFGPPGSGWLVGCLVCRGGVWPSLEDASLFAGYSPRAVLITAPPCDWTQVKVDAAILDQGVVVDRMSGPLLLAEPGGVVPSPLQDGERWRSDPGWAKLRKAIDYAPPHPTWIWPPRTDRGRSA
jgi:hypothetical protein